MKKKLEADLISLAHSILQMKNRSDVFALKEKSREMYEKLSLFAFVEEYVSTTPQLVKTKQELICDIENALEKKNAKSKNKTPKEPILLNEEPLNINAKQLTFETQDIEQPFDELENLMFSMEQPSNNFKNDVKDVGERKTSTLEEELEDTISVDEMATLFDAVSPKSLNDSFSKSIQIGLNDRIAFVKNLFNNNQEGFNRVLSQLNTFNTKNEATLFIKNVVKPDYNWEKHQDLEARFLEIIERRFA